MKGQASSLNIRKVFCLLNSLLAYLVLFMSHTNVQVFHSFLGCLLGPFLPSIVLSQVSAVN